MPKNPLDLLKQLPQPLAEGPTDRRAWDAAAAQKQASEPLWKKVGQNALDFMTSPFVDDPLDEKTASGLSWGSKAAQLAMAAPGLPHLPKIAPEAYNDVKAGGLRLYSRLTDAFAKAPNVMTPAKVRSVAANGASADEIGLRKLEALLSGRGHMDQIPREDVMKHLAANPINLEVERKGKAYAPTIGSVVDAQAEGDQTYLRLHDAHQAAREQVNQMRHELDTRYGGNWEDPTDVPTPGAAQPTTEEINAFTDALGAQDDAEMALNQHVNNNRDYATEGQHLSMHEYLQTNGPKDNYGETLFKLPTDNPDDVFKHNHFPEDPNVVAFSRHSDRRLNPTATHTPDADQAFLSQYGSVPDESMATGGSKGRFIDEDQSDWHQQGNKFGYKGDPLPPHELLDHSASNPDMRPPDAPFKDSYYELPLKQHLLEAANDPSLDWVGIGDAMTASQMEGHTKQLGGPGMKPGIEQYYDKKHPKALERLLKPFGGGVEYANLPTDDVVTAGMGVGGEGNAPPGKVTGYRATREGANAMSFIPPGHPAQPGPLGPAEEFKYLNNNVPEGRPVPGPGFWKTKTLTPEMKALIKERGFPAMALLLAAQQSQQDK